MTIHLHSEARLHGSLDTFSAFQFENFMGGLKGLTKRYARPLEQIHNRIHEHSVIIGSQRDTEKLFRVYYAAKNCNRIVKIKTQRFTIAKNQPDAYCIVNDCVFFIEDLLKTNNSFNIAGRYVLNLQNLYDFPEIQSSLLGIYKCENILFSKDQAILFQSFQ
jgi:hypothetical protein